MPQYTMNTGAPEQDRTCDMQGFDNVAQYSRSMSLTEPTVPYERPRMTANEVNESSDTIKVPVPPSASDITRATRNG